MKKYLFTLLVILTLAINAAAQTVGKWTYKDGTYVSPRLAEEYDKTGPCRIVLSKGKIQIVLAEAFPAGYKKKMVIPGYLS